MCEEINSRNFDTEVIQSDMPVLLDFYATWCTPCRMLSDVLADISEIYDGMIRVCRVNVDEERGLAEKYDVYEIPTVIFFKNGRPVDRFSGFHSAEEVNDMISVIYKGF